MQSGASLGRPMTEHAPLAYELLAPLMPPTMAARVTDADFIADCVECRSRKPLTECLIHRGTETRFICGGCHQTLVIGGPSEQAPTEGRSWGIGKFVLRNAVDLRFGVAVFPARGAATSGKLPE